MIRTNLGKTQVETNYEPYKSVDLSTKPPLFINPKSIDGKSLKAAAGKIRSYQFAECSNFAAGAAGVLLNAAEAGKISGGIQYNPSWYF